MAQQRTTLMVINFLVLTLIVAGGVVASEYVMADTGSVPEAINSVLSAIESNVLDQRFILANALLDVIASIQA